MVLNVGQVRSHLVGENKWFKDDSGRLGGLWG